MSRVVALLAMVVASVSLVVSAPASADSRYGKQKVVYHINYDGGSDDKPYLKALKNVQNHINAVGKDNIEVRIVLHGDGVYMLRDAVKNLKLQGAVTNLKTQKVAFNVCANTLKGRKLDPDKDLFEVFKEDIVPSGVAELSYLQGQGFTYVKP